MSKTDTISITRRHMLQGTGAAALVGGFGLGRARAEGGGFGPAPEWMRLLGVSEQGGRYSAPRIEGEIPTDLRGSLYRNGPGLFERGGVAIRHLLDGDGLVQRLSFTDAGVRYQNRFVRTAKYVAEEAADERLQATWTTRKTESFLDNIGGGVSGSQAGVTVYPVHGKVLARDEVGPTYEVDGENLETLGTIAAGKGLDDVGFKAHSKLDPDTGEWILLGTKFGPSMRIHVAIYEPTLRHKTQFEVESPRQVYVHDFMVTKRHIVVVLHPCEFSPFGFLAGMNSFTDSLTWAPQEGNLIAVLPRDGGDARFFDAPAAFVWHALNAYDTDEGLVADLVGYDEPDHFIGPDALFANLMVGRLGRAEAPGRILRYRIDLKAGRLRQEVVDAGNHEFPMIDPRVAMTRHRVGYFASGGLGGFNSGLKRLDYETAATQVFDFGTQTQVGEPVFAGRPGGALDDGWLIAQCLDGASMTTFFAVFDAARVDAGPVAKLWLDHHVPISFHGAWLG